MGKKAKQQKKLKTPSWWRRFCFSAIKWVAGFVFLGIATQLFGGIFSAWAIAIKNASKGFLHKFADTYFIQAATTELTDSASSFSLIVGIMALSGLWFLLKAVKLHIDQTEKDIAEISDYKPASSLSDMVDHLSKQTEERKQRAWSLKKEIDNERKWLKTTKVLFWILVCFDVYAISGDTVAYALVKGYRQDVVKIRPFISDSEYHHLNRQWVLMKSREDYRAIQKQIAEYKKRGESDGKSDE